MRAVARAATSLCVGGLALTVLNAATAPRARARAGVLLDPAEAITVCIPARDEEEVLPRLIGDLRIQRPAFPMRVLILDDRSTDGTADAARVAIDGDDRFTILSGAGPTSSTDVGKSVACIALGRAALDTGVIGDVASDGDNSGGGEPRRPTAIVFLDADVRLTPDALAAAVVQMRRSGVALLSPWPLQIARTAAEVLVQPLLCWSWSATLPLILANRGTGTSTAVAIGQFLVMDAAAYASIGGHESTRTSVTDDLELARTFRRRGLRTAVAYGGEVASCRMYTSPAQVREGYTRWLWSAFGSTGTPVVVTAALAAYLLPAVSTLTGVGSRRHAALAWAAAVASRVVARHSEGSTSCADLVSAIAHPVAAAAASALVLDSVRGRRRGTLTWKNRRLDV